MRLDITTMVKLAKCEIIEIRGVSGAPATVEQARQAPSLVRVYAMSGLVFDVDYDHRTDMFTLTEVREAND